MIPWRFMDYVMPSGRNPVKEWSAAQGDEVRAALKFTIYQLRVTADWVDPETRRFSLLKGKHLGLSELRFWTEDGRKFRVFGLYRPNNHDFVCFVGCEKWMRGSIYKPFGAIDLAMKHKKNFDAGKGQIIDHT
jgi:hypothetical protein